MTSKNSKNNHKNNPIIPDIDDLASQEDVVDQAIEKELAPDIARALNVKPKKIATIAEIDYIAETDLEGVEIDNVSVKETL